MNAMQKLAAQENAAARRTWNAGEMRDEIAKELPIAVDCSNAFGSKTLRQIVRIVSEETKIPVEKIMGHDRRRNVVRARQYCMWKARARGYSLPQIGDHFNRDHTTVLHGCRVMDKIMRAKK